MEREIFVFSVTTADDFVLVKFHIYEGTAETIEGQTVFVRSSIILSDEAYFDYPFVEQDIRDYLANKLSTNLGGKINRGVSW
jgi:hypothetical protein